MNLEELISKYLDGELTAQEDEILRLRISEDSTARLKFDSAVNLHLAYKEDAESIFPPDDLVDSTEDLILMKIFAGAPDYKSKRTFVWSNMPMMAALIAFFMFIFVFEIDDFNRNGLDQRIISKINLNDFKNSPSEVQTGDKPIKQFDESLINNEILTFKNSDHAVEQEILVNTQDVNSTVISDQSITSDLSSIEVTDQVENSTKVIEDQRTIPSLSLASVPQFEYDAPIAINTGTSKLAGESNRNSMFFMNKPSVPLDVNLKNNINTVLAVNAKPVNSSQVIDLVNSDNVIPEFDDFYSKSDIQVASFFGTDVVRGGIDAEEAIVSHFSQSVAYDLNENDRFGVELGYTEYTYQQKMTLYVKSGAGASTSGVESNESGYDLSVLYPSQATIFNNKQMVWASAFYESTLYGYEDLSLVGRLGAGSSSDGPLGYGRIFAQYNIYGGIYFTLGAEGRMFKAEMSKFVTDSDKLKTTASIIYGFQFKF